MNKAVSSVFSEIFVNNLFELDSYACKCEKDTKNIVPGEPPETTLKIYGLADHPIHFSYSDKDGLNLTGNQGRVLIKNILGQVLALKENDADVYIRLIQKIGFVLPVSFENYEAVDLNALIEFADAKGEGYHRLILSNGNWCIYLAMLHGSETVKISFECLFDLLLS